MYYDYSFCSILDNNDANSTRFVLGKKPVAYGVIRDIIPLDLNNVKLVEDCIRCDYIPLFDSFENKENIK